MFKVKIQTEGLSDVEKSKVMFAGEKIERVFNSEQFRDWVLNFSYPLITCTGSLWWKRCTSKQVRGFAYSNGLTNMQILEKLLSGKEVLTPIEDNEADIFLKIDRRGSRNVLGYTYPNTKWQWIYSNFFSSYSVDDIAANLGHEWCHKASFDHSYKYTPDRAYSVPYAVGYYIGKFKN